MTEALVFAKPVITIFHVLSVVLGMGSALVVDMICFRYGYHKVLSKQTIGTIRFLSHVVTIALLCILATGFLLFLSDVPRYSASVKFLTKMSVVGVLTINGLLLHRFIFPRLSDDNILTSKRGQTIRKIGFALGSISFVSWLCALSLGVLSAIPVSLPVALCLYVLLLACSVIVSQILEQYLLEYHARKQSL